LLLLFLWNPSFYSQKVTDKTIKWVSLEQALENQAKQQRRRAIAVALVAVAAYLEWQAAGQTSAQNLSYIWIQVGLLISAAWLVLKTDNPNSK
jgi:ubiquinone biosynthesis protein